MKTFVTLLALVVAVVFVVPAFAGEEPYKAAVGDDSAVHNFYLSPKVQQFTHNKTAYYSGCFLCTEGFKSKTAVTQPEVCATTSWVEKCTYCHGEKVTSKTGANNNGWYEWVIAIPKKPEGEMNLEIECGILKPNSWSFLEHDAINFCAAETGEPIGAGICTRVAGGLLKPGALPMLEVTAHPGCQNNFAPFHLTAYRNPSNYSITREGPGGPLKNSSSLQVLNGSSGARIALKGCMEKTVLIKWPVEGTLNSLGETEANLEAGDLIKVRMVVPTANTVDIYCGKWSVTIGGIGEPDTLLDQGDCPCVSDCGI